MRFLGGVFLLALLAGCSTALDREGRCLAGMIPEVLRAEEEVRSLEESWRTLERAKQQDTQTRVTLPAVRSAAVLLLTDRNSSLPSEVSGSFHDEQDKQIAYNRLVEAKSRRHETFSWYDRVVRRFRTRVEEDEMLSQARTVLMAWPGIVFYPIVRWNVRSVLWDGIDPDAETDPVTHFCAGRLLALETASLPLE